MSESLKIKCDIYWAQLKKMNQMSEAYQVNLCNISDAAAKALEEMGITVNFDGKKKPEMGKYITCKSKNRPMKAYDVDGEEIDAEIGNGSKAKALVTPYSWTYKNKKGISPSLKKLVITELVEYGEGALSADDEDVL